MATYPSIYLIRLCIYTYRRIYSYIYRAISPSHTYSLTHSLTHSLSLSVHITICMYAYMVTRGVYTHAHRHACMHPSIHTYVQAGIHTAHTVLVTENTYNMMHAFYILYKSKRVRIHVYIYIYLCEPVCIYLCIHARYGNKHVCLLVWQRVPDVMQ